MNRIPRFHFTKPVLNILDRRRLLLLGFAFCLFIFSSPNQVSAHPISLTNTHVRVFPDKVQVKIEFFIEDLYLFHDLKPNKEDILEPETVEKGIELHKPFLLKHFLILDSQGEPLTGKVVNVRDYAPPEEGFPLASLMFFKITFDLEYALDAPPEFLTFDQDLGMTEQDVPAEMQIRVLQKGAKRRKEKLLLPNDPFILRFDWENPETSDVTEGDLQAKDDPEATKEEFLGITSYGAVYSFLYLEPREVRHEILVPLVTLEQNLDIPRKDPSFLEVEEQEIARKIIGDFMKDKNPISVNEQLLEPIVSRVDFYGLDFRDFAQQAPEKKVSTANGRVGIILRYELKEPINELFLFWDFFNRYLWDVRCIVYTDEETIKVELSRLNEQNTFTWTNPNPESAFAPIEEIPVNLPPAPEWPVSIPAGLCLLGAVFSFFSSDSRRVGTGLLILTVILLFIPFGQINAASWFLSPPELEEEVAEETFQQLHRNIYRALEFRSEDEIYDVLAQSASGELLQDLYLKMKQGLIVEEQGGPVARVSDVKLIETMQLPVSKDVELDSRSFGIKALWQVVGTVEHWGHVHNRTVEYDAEFIVAPEDQFWKIVKLNVNREDRLTQETKLRGL